MALAIATAIVGLAALVGPRAAFAQKWSVDAGVSSELTRTSNADLGGTDGRADTIFDIRPHVRFRGEGARLKFFGSAALSAVAYGEHTQPNRLQPDIDLNANLEAIERFLFLDAGLRALQSSADPFGARPESGATSENSLTTTLVRFAPRIEGSAGNLLRYRVLSENSWTHESGATTTVTGSDAVGYFGRHTVSIGNDPRPLGWQFEAQRSETRYRDTTQEPLVLDLARVTLDYMLGEDLTLGIRGGHEHTNFASGDSGGNLYGVQARWQPSPRTLIAAFQEHRFFGSSWRVAFDHRTPHVAWNIAASRSLETAPQSVLDLPASDNVAALLDAMFTTRYPDPVERARVVDDLIARQGLPTSTLQPVSLRAQRLSLVTLASASVGLIGVRNSLALTIFQARTEDAFDTGPFAIASALTNNIQQGAAIAFNHRLTPLIALTASADWSRIRALEGVGGERSIQRTVRLRLNVEVLPKTRAFAGARVRVFDSNTAIDGNEHAVFVGLDHRF